MIGELVRSWVGGWWVVLRLVWLLVLFRVVTLPLSLAAYVLKTGDGVLAEGGSIRWEVLGFWVVCLVWGPHALYAVAKWTGCFLAAKPIGWHTGRLRRAVIPETGVVVELDESSERLA